MATNERDAIYAQDILKMYNAIKIGDTLSLSGQRGGRFETAADLYRNVKGQVLYKHKYFVVFNTGKWRVCINYSAIMMAKTKIKINGKGWSR